MAKVLIQDYTPISLRETVQMFKAYKDGVIEYEGNMWRLWDEQPTEEEMEATPWPR